jgi:hypothetical protein
MNQQLLNWLKENLSRLFTKSPKFFRIWNLIGALLTIICGIPLLLKQCGIELDEPLNSLSNKLVTGAGIAMFWMTKLTSQSAPVSITQQGEVIKKVNEEKLPFTAESEKKEAVAAGVEVK